MKPKNFKTVETLARLFGVDINYLTGYTDKKYANEQALKPVPILGIIASGKPVLAQEDIVGFKYTAPEERIDFCLTVRGDSMANARICEGDIIYVRKQDVVENGEIAVVMIDDEEDTLKRFYRIDGTVLLRAENPKYKDIEISGKDRKKVRILGKVMSFKSSAR